MEGTAIQSMEPDAIVRRGIVHVPEGREIFPLMTVGENIAMGAIPAMTDPRSRWTRK